jgi:pimeloyl-ACP methyl ester carboxylesterase
VARRCHSRMPSLPGGQDLMGDKRVNPVEEFKVAQERLLRRFGVDAESRFFKVSAVSGRVHALIRGEGPPVVMVPGFGDPAAMWAPLMAELNGFKLYAVDRPCFGLTGCAEHATATLRVLAVDFLEQVLDVLGLDRPLLVGNSIGSLWSTWLALDRPGRVAALVHIGCPAFILGTSAPPLMRFLSIRPLGRLLMRMSPPVPRQVERFARMIGEDLSNVPELRDLLVAAQKLPGVQAAIRDLLHSVVRLRGARPEIALRAGQLAEIQQPVLLIWGAHDAFGAPEVGEKAARVISDAELRIIPDGGHIPWVAHPAEVASAAAPFLRVHGRGSGAGAGMKTQEGR